MNHLTKQLGWCVVLACIVVPVALAGETETQENPIYKHWAQFKPGTYVVWKQTMESGEQKSVTMTTHTLKEVTAEKVVLEMKAVTEVAGQKMESPVQTIEHLATITVEKSATEAQTVAQEKPDYKFEQGEEEIEVAGKKIKTKWMRAETREGQVVATNQTWNSDQVPGQLVKTITETTGDHPTRMTTEVVEFEIKK